MGPASLESVGDDMALTALDQGYLPGPTRKLMGVPGVSSGFKYELIF